MCMRERVRACISIRCCVCMSQYVHANSHSVLVCVCVYECVRECVCMSVCACVCVYFTGTINKNSYKNKRNNIT